ncbi:TPA: phenylacetic acid degradation protein [Candidatus Poribacteria bacterium]|nr:phenylacetic acid degradation protein [Candidatus Poribacteria bacterium]
MMRFTAALTLFLLLASTATIATADIFSYLEIEDGAYKWELVSQKDLGNGITGYGLNLTSQIWQGITWQHRLNIILPKDVESPTIALLLITGGSWTNQDRWEKEETEYGSLIASAIDAPVAVLHDIPYQPLFDKLKEDDLISFTFSKYLLTGDDTWPLLLPMTKGAVKAMNAVQEFAKANLGVEVNGFVVTGASKRGWTTWFTGVVDKRVKAIAPMVYDNLGLENQMKHQLEAWGKFSEQIKEYTERGLPQKLLENNSESDKLVSIVDPFTYVDKITVPKLSIIGTNDRYWPLDALNIYWDSLVGEKYILYVPNSGHGLEDISRVISDIICFSLKASGKLRFPKLIWGFDESDEAVKLSVSSDIKPETVSAWVAKSPTRDFRDVRWEESSMTLQNGSYFYKLEKPDNLFVAIFGEAAYLKDGKKFYLSTNVKIFK